MRLLSAHEDFVERTMGAVHGTLEKLEFFSGIRSSAEEYHHWGMERTYGRECAQDAIRKAHTTAFVAELSTPLSDLWAELVSAAESQGTDMLESAQAILAAPGVVPQELGGGSRAHHHYVLTSLFLLARTRALTSRQGA